MSPRVIGKSAAVTRFEKLQPFTLDCLSLSTVPNRLSATLSTLRDTNALNWPPRELPAVLPKVLDFTLSQPLLSTSPVAQTGRLFSGTVCLLVAYLPTNPGAKQHKCDQQEARTILEKPLWHAGNLLILKQRTQTGKKGSSRVQEPKQVVTLRWSGTLMLGLT